MTRINIVTRNGDEVEIESPEGEPLMWALRDQNLDVEAVCGGAVSCATCHVYIAEDWYEKLEAPDEFETALLDDLVHTTQSSRLSCQVIMNEKLDGLRLAIAPSEE